MLAYLTTSGVNVVVLVIAWFTFGLKAFAFVDALLRRSEAFTAVGKQTKLIWLALLGVALLVNLAIAYPLGLLNIVGDVIAIVYLVDVRPAIRGLGGGGSIRRRRGGSSSDW